MNTLRCSMVPGWNDCARRAFAKQWPKLVSGAGHELRDVLPSVGAAIGTAVHRIVEALATGEGDATEDAIAAFNTEIARGCVWDDRTRNPLDAEKQIRNLARAFRPLLQGVEPVLCEQRLETTLRNGWKLTGTPDLYERPQSKGGLLRDHKTGRPWPYGAQIGAYLVLLEDNDHPVDEARVQWVRRVKSDKAQPPVLTKTWEGEDLDRMEGVALANLERITETVERFEASRNPNIIPANPMSMMCSERFCPAWGTSFCREWEREPGADHHETEDSA